MVNAETPFQVLYVSQLAPGSDFGVVKEIVTVSRLRNPARGISGVLLFDGERFGQLIEGAEADVQALLRSIEGDPRHTGVRVLFAGPSDTGRVMQRWASGYCDVSELEPFHAAVGLRDRAALDAFVTVLKGADIE